MCYAGIMQSDALEVYCHIQPATLLIFSQCVTFDCISRDDVAKYEKRNQKRNEARRRCCHSLSTIYLILAHLISHGTFQSKAVVERRIAERVQHTCIFKSQSLSSDYGISHFTAYRYCCRRSHSKGEREKSHGYARYY